MSAMKFKYCPVCECGFFYRRESAKFCSPACKQKAHRIANGQTLVRSEENRRTVEGLSEKRFCPHCGCRFNTNTTGRKRVFCSNSCKSSFNRFKKAAAWRFVKWVKQMDDYAALQWIDANKVVAVDELALRIGARYSDVQRQYVCGTLEMFEETNA